MKLLGYKIDKPEELQEKTLNVSDFVDTKTDWKERVLYSFLFENKNTRRYIGKIVKDPKGRKDSFYTDDMIEGSLRYLVEMSKQGDIITIQIGPELSEICNGKDDLKEYMTPEEEKIYIQNIFQSVVESTKRKNIQLKITSFEGEHPEFFSKLRTGLIKENILPKEPNSTEQKTTIDDIASYLMWATNTCPDFSKILEGTKVKGAKKTDKNQPEMYGFVEVSCRLYEFLHDEITTQGGGERQSKYDNIIRILLHGIYPDLKPFQDFLKAKLGEKKFTNIYMQKGKYKEFKNDEEGNTTIQKKRKENIRRRWRNIMITTTALSTVLGGVGMYQGHKYKKQIEADQQKEQKIVEDKGLEKNTLNILDAGTNDIVTIIDELYGGKITNARPEIQRNNLTKMIKDALLNHGMYNIHTLSYKEKTEFLQKYIEKNAMLLSASNTIPYARLEEKAINKTLNTQGEISGMYCSSGNNDGQFHPNKDNTYIATYYQELNQRTPDRQPTRESLGIQYIKMYRDSKGKPWGVLIVKGPHDEILYLATEIEEDDASSFRMGSTGSGKKFTLDNGKYICQDFLKTRRATP